MTAPVEAGEASVDTAGGHPRRWVILAVLCLALQVIIIDEVVLNVALPAIVRQLHATSSELQWAVDAYVLVYAALLFPAGSLGDRHGRRRTLLLGLVVFGVGSGFATWATSPGALIAARALMGVGGALIMPATLSLIVVVFAPHERGLAIGIWSGVSGIGILLGPIVAGLLIERYWWGSVFLVNVPVVVLALVAGRLLLPESHDRAVAPSDPLGALLAACALGAALYAVIEWPARGIGDPGVLTGALVGLVAGVAFLAVELRQRSPMLDLRVLRVPVVGLSCAVVVVGFLTIAGSGFVLTQFLQVGQGRSPVMTGLVFAPATAGWSLGAPCSPWLVRRIGVRRAVALPLAAVGATYVALLVAPSQIATPWLLAIFAVQGLGMGFTTTPVTELIVSGLPPEHAGVASALNDAARQVGAAVGIAVCGSLLAAGFHHGMSGHGVGPEIDNLAAAVGRHEFATARRAFQSGYRWVMGLCAALCLAVAAVLALSRRFRAPAG